MSTEGAAMAFYDLLDRQKEALREMVRIVQETGENSFYYVATFGNPRAIMFPSTPQRSTNASLDDLQVFESEGLVTLRYKSDGKLSGGSVRRAAVDAVKADFQRPAVASVGGSVQNFFAPVGAVHTGVGNIAIQNLGMGADEVANLIQRLRGLLPELPPESRIEAEEQLSDFEGEVRAPVPRQSRIKSFLLGLWNSGKDVAEFAANLTQIATAYGVQLPG
jgi:hypothetical protein